MDCEEPITLSLSFVQQAQEHENSFRLFLEGAASADVREICSYVEVEEERAVTWFFSMPSYALDSFSLRITQLFPAAVLRLVPSEVGWEEQAQIHSPFWSEKRCSLYIPVTDMHYLDLESGSAFGDGSHETTRLMLSHLSHYVEDSVCVDIGSGNGILALSAILCGARNSVGIDIDPIAIEISVRNAYRNDLASSVRFFHADDPTCMDYIQSLCMQQATSRIVLLINMTFGDIVSALPSYQKLISSAAYILLSGILKQQKKKALSFLYRAYNVIPLYEAEEGAWMFFVMSSDTRTASKIL